MTEVQAVFGRSQFRIAIFDDQWDLESDRQVEISKPDDFLQFYEKILECYERVQRYTE